MKQYLYLIESHDTFKVGYTKNINRRLKEYKTHNPEYKMIGKSSQNMTIFVDDMKGYSIGDIVDVKITNNRSHSLIGEIIEK